MVKTNKDKRVALLPVAAAGTLLAVGLVASPWTDRLELRLSDRAVRMSGPEPTSNLVLIAIDDASVARIGSWPWPHGVHAQLIAKLRDAEVPLIAFTAPLSEAPSANGLQQLREAIDLLQSDNLGRSAQGAELRNLLTQSMADLDQSAALADAIAQHGNVLMPIESRLGANKEEAEPLAKRASETLEGRIGDSNFVAASPELVQDALPPQQLHLPPEALIDRARLLGHVGFTPDVDGIVRKSTAAIRVGDRLVPSLGITIAAAMRGLRPNQLQINDDAELTLAKAQIELNNDLTWRPVSYPPSGRRALQQFSYWQILSGDVGKEQLQGKAIVVGLAGALASAPYTLPEGATTSFGTNLTSLQAVASSAASAYSGRAIAHPTWAPAFELLIIVGILALIWFVLSRIRLSSAVVAGLGVAAALLATEVLVLAFANTQLKLALPVLAIVVAVLALTVLGIYKRLRTPRGQGDPIESLRMLGLTFQGQGQLDLAYETFRRCPDDTQMLDLLYGLGQDYERRRQFRKALDVYAHITSVNGEYKDSAQRRERMKRADQVQGAGVAATPGPTTRNIASAEPPTASASGSRPASGYKQTLGRYEIERELGKGAMGVVYLGRDPKINRVVAIKAIALAEEFAEEDLADARARFFREAEMAGRLNHPGIVTVYDAGEDRGLAFIAMEFLRGEHLSHYAEPIYLLPVARVLSLAARVADALDYAHKQNVVHRDIKPANIMFNKDTDELKITDFGIARLTDTSRTKTGIVLGTPSFMSPEQLEGRPLDGRSDLFSLGITLYQLLSGQLPFRADSMTRLMQKIATEPHVPIRSLRPELSEMAEQIVVRSLAKNAVDRYQTGAEMASALRTCMRLTSRKEAIAR